MLKLGVTSNEELAAVYTNMRTLKSLQAILQYTTETWRDPWNPLHIYIKTLFHTTLFAIYNFWFIIGDPVLLLKKVSYTGSFRRPWNPFLACTMDFSTQIPSLDYPLCTYLIEFSHCTATIFCGNINFIYINDFFTPILYTLYM